MALKFYCTLYLSNQESKSRIRRGESMLHLTAGDGTLLTTASNTSVTPFPNLADT